MTVTVAAVLGACATGEGDVETGDELVISCVGRDGGPCELIPRIAECGYGVHPVETVVVDTRPPAVVDSWTPALPADDRMHRIGPKDCVVVEDACSPETHVVFTRIASDEPVVQRPTPYGWQVPDVLTEGCEAVLLRGYADPNGNGRVYTLDWRAIDGLGHTLDGTCEVHVPALPASVAVPEPPAYEIDSSRACRPF